jgi:hypothetical protein
MNKLRDLDLYLIIRCIQRSCPSAILIIFKPKKTPPTRQQSCRAPENGIIYLKTRFPLTVSILITVMQNEVLFDDPIWSFFVVWIGRDENSTLSGKTSATQLTHSSPVGARRK